MARLGPTPFIFRIILKQNYLGFLGGVDLPLFTFRISIIKLLWLIVIIIGLQFFVRAKCCGAIMSTRCPGSIHSTRTHDIRRCPLKSWDSWDFPGVLSQAYYDGRLSTSVVCYAQQRRQWLACPSIPWCCPSMTYAVLLSDDYIYCSL